MATVAEQIRNVRAHIPAGVTLVCVSKFQPIEAIREAYEAGERHFGESRVQELKQKTAQLPADIHWHFIGHLQTNKVRDLLKLRPYLIHSVDSEHLLKAINDEAAKQGIIQNILLEVHVAKEETKTGLSPMQIGVILDFAASNLHNIRILGLMTMATNTEDETEIRRCFQQAHSLLGNLPIFSAGMSDDYPIAIACGANMVRIGSSIFGERDYSQQSKIKNQKCQKIRAVFFDQDGILFNSMPYHAQAWVAAMGDHGLPYTALECYRNEGRTGSGVIQELYQRMHGEEAPQELLQTIYATKSQHFIRLTGGQLPETIPGVHEVLRFLHTHGVQCWVVTGSGQRNLINSLNNTFDGVFQGIISSFDVTHGKPDPEPYLKAWERSGFKKEECMVVENAPLGVRAAKNAGLFCAAVNTGILPDSDLKAEHADLVLPHMQALLEWFQQQL